MRRLENEGEDKFWEAWIKDYTIFCYRYGKIGSPGHTKIKKFKTLAEAEAELEAKLEEKLEEGFEEPGAADEEETAEEETADDEGADESDHVEAEESEDDDVEAEESEDDDAPDDEESEASDDDASEESEDEESEDDDEESEASDDDASEESEDEESEDDDESEESEDESDEESEESEDDDESEKKKQPRSRNRAEPLPVVEAEKKPSLPARMKLARQPTAQAAQRAAGALGALRDAAVAGRRSWQVARLARSARRALEAMGGSDLTHYPVVAAALDSVTRLVLASKHRLTLEDALGLLWVVDAKTFARTVAHWRALMLDSAVAPSLTVLAGVFDAVPDGEVAVHVATALVNRRLPQAAFGRWFSAIKPFLTESLATRNTNLETFAATLRPGNDEVLKSRLAEVKP